MKTYCIGLLLLFVGEVAYSQSYQDVVYLKNGSIIRGMITEEVPSVSIKIESAGNVFYFKFDEIEKIVKELALNQPKNGGRLRSVGTSGLTKGYQGFVEIGYAYGGGIDDGGSKAIKFNFVNAYRINPFIALGLGTGLRHFPEYGKTTVPIYFDFRANLIDKEISPYIDLGIGYSADAKDNFKGVGTFLSPAIGATFKIAKKSSVHVAFNFELQILEDNPNYDFWMTELLLGNYRCFGIIVGFSF